MQEGGAQAVKLEGGATVVPTVQRIVGSGIPVMGHLGLTPQSVHQLGGYRVQGRTAEVAGQLLADAAALEAAGAFSIVLECVPAQLAGEISRRIQIPTIGIGAGPQCDGQVQVLYDLLGLFTDFTPRHARRYAELGEAIKTAVRQYADDVTAGSFPTKAQSFSMNETVLQSLYGPAPDQTPAATP
jgi:3-methyl-2-oxobutanoate hydroxymethyltransferase